MSENKQSIEKMWNDYLTTIDDKTSDKEYEAWSFCYDEESANKLAKLVKEGKKTATSSLHYLYEVENEDLPEVGDYSIILDGSGEAQCVIKNTKVDIIPFNEVTEEIARTEGEGDRSLAYWRNVHREFFEEELKELEKEFSEDMLVVCEVFEVVYMK